VEKYDEMEKTQFGTGSEGLETALVPNLNEKGLQMGNYWDVLATQFH